MQFFKQLIQTHPKRLVDEAFAPLLMEFSPISTPSAQGDKEQSPRAQ
jgi:hypothetical protein